VNLLGFALAQKVEGRRLRVVAFGNKKLNETQSKCSLKKKVVYFRNGYVLISFCYL